MTTANLRYGLGEGNSLLASDHGDDSLYHVLLAQQTVAETLNAWMATPTTGVKAQCVMDKASRLDSLYVNVATTGSAGATTVEVNVNGVQKAVVTIDNADADGTGSGMDLSDLDVVLAVNDVVSLEFVAVATDAAGVTATARVRAVKPVGTGA